MKRFLVAMGKEPAALLYAKEDGSFVLSYLPGYLQNTKSPPIAAMLPKKANAFEAPALFPFFQGLLPEGWLSEITEFGGVFLESEVQALDKLLKDPIGAAAVVGVGGESQQDIKGAMDQLQKSQQQMRKIPTQRFPPGSVAISPGFEPYQKMEAYQHLITNQKNALFQGLSNLVAAQLCLKCLSPHMKKGRLYHKSCAESLFGADVEIIAETSFDTFRRDAFSSLSSGAPIPGYQPKAPMIHHIAKGLQVQFILKPDLAINKNIERPLAGFPVFEHMAMEGARRLGMSVADSILVPMLDGTLAYVTRRFDRTLKGDKLHLEDMAQVLGKQKDPAGVEKYRCSFGKMAQKIMESSARDERPELALRCLYFLYIGNHDAHLKNYSLVTIPGDLVGKGESETFLSPAYDILPLNALKASERKQQSGLLIDGHRESVDLIHYMREMEIFGAKIHAELALDKLDSCRGELKSLFMDTLTAAGLESAKHEFLYFMKKRDNWLLHGIKSLRARALAKSAKKNMVAEIKLTGRGPGERCIMGDQCKNPNVNLRPTVLKVWHEDGRCAHCKPKGNA